MEKPDRSPESASEHLLLKALPTAAMVSTLAGNLTLIGSIANLIVVEKARGHVVVGFWTYARVGVPVTALTLGLGLLYFWLRFGA